ncbi:hypothetical protein TVAG_498190 [Trichomonas vaginalis G3]|uniref:Uncharacterized protein n=1 Tax=Trichomonas vaginalis (strain ATCC PRA-98 / G3) TaxID=412133 RepID=A2FLE9_TRIV3|nr:hypothetical protein TVAG_498190 [Trichomonas vaginalis G3]|eukprot:XP_001307195.1 hypothetical protein [Trichomonas vaginalis G3]
MAFASVFAPNSPEEIACKLSAPTGLEPQYQTAASTHSPSRTDHSLNPKPLSLPKTIPNELRITKNHSNAELRKILLRLSEEYFNSKPEERVPATFNKEYCEQLNKVLADFTKLQKETPDPFELGDTIVNYFPTITKIMVDRTICQLIESLPPKAAKKVEQFWVEFKLKSYGYQDDEEEREYGQETAKWQCLSSLNPKFKPLFYSDNNTIQVRKIAIHFVNQAEDIEEGDSISVYVCYCKFFKDEFGGPILMHVFKPRQQLYVETEITLMHGMYLKFESQLENTYNIWLSYIQFDTPDDFDVEEEDSTQEDEPQDSIQEESSEFTPED